MEMQRFILDWVLVVEIFIIGGAIYEQVRNMANDIRNIREDVRRRL